MNKPNIQNNIIDSINDLFSSTGFCFKNKVIEGSHKGKNSVF